MLSWKLGRQSETAAPATVGIALGPDQITLVAQDGELDGRPRVVAWETLPTASPGEIQVGLQRFVDANGLQGESCRCALSPEDYSLRLVERPANVPDEELVEATRWLVRDLIEFDVEQAELAIVTVPEDSQRARTPRMFVIAARPERVLDLAHAIEGAGLRLVGFEIVESAMLALESRMPRVVAGSAVLRIEDKSSVITLSHDEHLYLARNVNVDVDSLEAAARVALGDADPTGPDIAELLDPVLLDVQRSLDYYESEYGQAPASRLALLPGPVDLTPIVPALSEALRPMRVESYELGRDFSIEPDPTFESLPALAIACGALAARPELLGDSLVPRLFRQRAGGFGLASVLRVAAAIALLLGLYYAIARFQLGQEAGTLARLEADREAIAGRLETHLAEASARAASLDPERELEALRARRDARRLMLRDLGRNRARSDASFSNLLAGLARQDLDGIWLERIEFSQGGDAIAIEGRTIQPEDVPSFLRGLGSEKGFERRRFRSFEIARADTASPGLAFRVATRDPNADVAGDAR